MHPDILAATARLHVEELARQAATRRRRTKHRGTRSAGSPPVLSGR